MKAPIQDASLSLRERLRQATDLEVDPVRRRLLLDVIAHTNSLDRRTRRAEEAIFRFFPGATDSKGHLKPQYQHDQIDVEKFSEEHADHIGKITTENRHNVALADEAQKRTAKIIERATAMLDAVLKVKRPVEPAKADAELATAEHDLRVEIGQAEGLLAAKVKKGAVVK